MNTKIIIGLLGAAVIVVGSYFIFGNKAPSNIHEDPDTASEAAESGIFTGSLYELAGRGGSWKCTIDAATNTGNSSSVSSGTVYVSGTNVRGNFTSEISGSGTVESHMISDGTSVYAWTSAYPQGFKMKMTAAESHAQAAQGQGYDANQRYSYDCDQATPDASLFVPPADISFQAI